MVPSSDQKSTVSQGAEGAINEGSNAQSASALEEPEEFTRFGPEPVTKRTLRKRKGTVLKLWMPGDLLSLLQEGAENHGSNLADWVRITLSRFVKEELKPVPPGGMIVIPSKQRVHMILEPAEATA